MRLPGLGESIGILGIAGLVVVAAGADLVVVTGGLYLLGAHSNAADLAGPGLTRNAVAMRGRVLVALGLWPIVGALVVATQKLCVSQQPRLFRTALFAAGFGQALAVVAALATSL